MPRNARPRPSFPTYEAVSAVVTRLFSSTVEGQVRTPVRVVDRLRRGSQVVGRKLKWVVGREWFASENKANRVATMAILHDMLEDIRVGLGSLVIASTWNSRDGTNAYAIRVYEDEDLHQQEVLRIARRGREADCD